MIYVDLFGFMITDGNLPELHHFAKQLRLNEQKDFFYTRYPHYRLSTILGGKRIANTKKIEEAFNRGAMIVSQEKMKEINKASRELRRLSRVMDRKFPDLPYIGE